MIKGNSDFPERKMSMAQHRISLKPGTEKVGLPASQLLANPHLKQPQIKCPLCETLVDIPSSLEGDIRALAQRLGGEHMNLRFMIHHPPEIPETRSGQRILLDPQREAELREAFQKE
jgi:hypothetical protein